jgi:hypothetical protein
MIRLICWGQDGIRRDQLAPSDKPLGNAENGDRTVNMHIAEYDAQVRGCQYWYRCSMPCAPGWVGTAEGR